VLEGWRVTALEPSGGGVRLVAEAGAVEAPHVVLCLNAFLPHLVPALSAFVRPVRAQMLATAPAAPFLDRPVYSHEGFFYVRQLPDGRVLAGGARHLHLDAEVGYEDATTEALQADLEAHLRRHFPAAAGAPVERRWSGTMGFSPDGLPVVGAAPGVPGALFACGFTGHGMAFGARFGLLLARLALGMNDEAGDLFAAERLVP
jgi:gamma-glutamylputrescine oxidase